MTQPPPDADILVQHASFVRSIARGLLRDDHRADDVVQESMLAALQKPPSGDLRAWLGAVARKLSLRSRRAESRHAQRERRTARRESLPSTVEAVARMEIQRRVVEAVLRLPEPYRTTILLRYLYDIGVAELATRLGVPRETVKTRIRRGLAKLRAELDSEHGGRNAWSVLLLPALGHVETQATHAMGALLMSTKTKVAIALALSLLITALFGWRLLRRGDKEVPRALPASLATDTAPQEEPADEEHVALPPPVDFMQIDRDLDLHGVVVRKTDGAPIAGAKLQVVTYPWRRANVLNHDGYYEIAAGPRTLSAEDGTFVLRLRPGADVALRVHAEGYALLELAKRQAGERVRIEMDAGVGLTVITRDERGDPASGTRLRLWRTDGDAPMVSGVTDVQGRFAFPSLPGPAVYGVEVDPESLGNPGWEVVRLPESGEHEHVVTLPEGRTLTGRVTDPATGDPIADAQVGMNWVLQPFAMTDGDGRYSLPGWTGKGVQDIHCVANGYGRAQRMVKSGDVYDFALSKGDGVTGRLLGADGRPVAGAPVSTVGRNDQGQICTRSGRSNGDGMFLLSGLRRDMPHTLVIAATDHGRYLLDFDPHPDEAGTIDIGNIELPAAHTIAGRVLTDSKTPVARIEVNLSGHNSDRGRLRGVEANRSLTYGTTETRLTDDLGRFRFPDQSPGEYTVRVRQPGATQEQNLTVVEGHDRLDVEISLPEGKEFTVTVVDEEGTPVPSVFVSVSTGQPTLNGQSDAQGRVTFFVTDKVTRVTAHPFASGRDLLRADTNVESDVNEFRVVLREAATISGRVLDERGQPLFHAWIAATKDGKRVASARSGSNGAFTIKVPANGTFDVAFTRLTQARRGSGHDEYRGSVQGVRSGARDIELRLRRVVIDQDRTLRVKVVYPDGTPAAGVTVFADRKRAATDGAGIAKFAGLPGKEISVNAFRPQDRTDLVYPHAVTVVPTGQEVLVTFRTAATITGVVLMPDGTPAAGATVQIRAGGHIRYRAATDDHGRFTASVAADEPGPWAVYAELRGKGLTAKVKEVRTGAADLRVQLK